MRPQETIEEELSAAMEKIIAHICPNVQGWQRTRLADELTTGVMKVMVPELEDSWILADLRDE